MSEYIIEPACGNLPLEPNGRYHECHVYHTVKNIISGKNPRCLVFSGSKHECEQFVARKYA